MIHKNEQYNKLYLGKESNLKLATSIMWLNVKITLISYTVWDGYN